MRMGDAGLAFEVTEENRSSSRVHLWGCGIAASKLVSVLLSVTSLKNSEEEKYRAVMFEVYQSLPIS